jgi:hypothetical protein
MCFCRRVGSGSGLGTKSGTAGLMTDEQILFVGRIRQLAIDMNARGGTLEELISVLADPYQVRELMLPPAKLGGSR